MGWVPLRIVVLAGAALAAGCIDRALGVPLETSVLEGRDGAFERDGGAPDEDLAVAVDLTTAADLATPPDLVFVPGPHALRCNGSSTAVGVTLPAVLNRPLALTIEFWFRATDMRTRFEGSLVAFGHLLVGYFIDPSLDGSPTFLHVAAFLSEFAPHPLARGAWHHFAVQYAPGAPGLFRYRWFLDGVVQHDESRPVQEILSFMSDTIWICGWMDGDDWVDRPFDGEIDELHVSTVARYDTDFVPAERAADDQTLALLHFDSEPLVDSGPLAHLVTPIGPIMLAAPHP